MSKFLLYLIFISFFTRQLRAQDLNKDAAVWVNIYLEKKIAKNLLIHLNQQDRINYNVSEFGLGYADMGFTYRFTKNIKLLTDYVYIRRIRTDNSYGNRHQAYIALIFKKDLGKFSFSYRNMLQTDAENLTRTFDGSKIPLFSDRNKLTVKYEINKRYSAYIAQELFCPLYQIKNPGLSRSRSFIGVFYNLTKDDQLEFYYAYQRQFHSKKETNVVYIYGIGYAHKF